MKDDSELNIKKTPTLVISTQEMYDSMMQITIVLYF